MKIIFLASVHPFFGHVKASYLALASILKACGEDGHHVEWATLSPPNELDEKTRATLESVGVRHFGNFAKEEVISEPRRVAEQLKQSEADVGILFWDSPFEHVLPYMSPLPMIGYLTKQPFGAAMVRLKNLRVERWRDKMSNWWYYQRLRYQEQQHLRRLRYLKTSSDHSLADAQYYQAAKIPCTYIPNTFPDFFGPTWHEQRQQQEAKRKRFGFLGNIGQVFGTGNYFGLSFMADHILPQLPHVLSDLDWEINICGQGTMDEELQRKLTHPRVNLKGFVDHLDEELLGNPIFLNFNNASPLITGYTRVIYAFSCGSCLIAHKDIVLAMPEVKHEYNALLGSSAKEILELIQEAAHNKNLREKIGFQARLTYETAYHPNVVTGQLIGLAKHALDTIRSSS